MIYRGTIGYHKGGFNVLSVHEYSGSNEWEIVYSGDSITCARDLHAKAFAAFCNANHSKKSVFYFCGVNGTGAA